MGLSYDERADEVVLFGGFDSTVDEYKNDTWTWDGTTWSLLTPSTGPPKRITGVMAFDSARGESVLFGGRNGSLCCDLADTWTFRDGAWDGTDWTQLSPRHSPSKRGSATSAYDPRRDELVLFGGNVENQGVSGDTWKLGKNTWRQLDLKPAPEARNLSAMVWDSLSNRAVLFGGYDGRTFDDT